MFNVSQLAILIHLSPAHSLPITSPFLLYKQQTVLTEQHCSRFYDTPCIPASDVRHQQCALHGHYDHLVSCRRVSQRCCLRDVAPSHPNRTICCHPHIAAFFKKTAPYLRVAFIRCPWMECLPPRSDPMSKQSALINTGPDLGGPFSIPMHNKYIPSSKVCTGMWHRATLEPKSAGIERQPQAA